VATAVEVSNLFATLGFKLDKGAWARGDSAIENTKSALGSLAKLAAGAFAGFGIGSALKSGLTFNATLEDTRTQIAGMLSLAKHTDLADQFANADGLMSSLQERAKKLPGSMTDYTKVLGMIAQPITDAGIGLKDLEDITVGAAVAAKAMSVDLEAGARDVNQAIMGQFHSTDQLTGRILGSLGYVGEAGRKRFNELSKARRAAVLKEALTQKQLAQLADAQSKSASGRWDTFKANLQETLGRVAAPLFAKLSTLLGGINDWLDRNGDALAKVAGVIGGALATAFDAIVAAIVFLTSGSDEAIAVLIGIGNVIAGLVVPALWSMVAGWVAAAAPILLSVAAVAAVSYGVIKLIKNWDKVRNAAGRAWDFIKRKASDAGSFVVSIPGRINDAFFRMSEAIKQFLSDAFEWVVRQAQALPGRVWSAVKGAVTSTVSVGPDQIRALAAKNPSLVGGSTAFDAFAHQTPSVSGTPVFEAPAGAAAGGRSVNIGATTVNIDATNMTPQQLEQHLGNFWDDRFGDHLRAED
jgi:hypothetical protein